MGKGDKKSKRGKIIIGSFGVRRPRKTRKSVKPQPAPAKAAARPKPPVVAEVAETPEVIAENLVQPAAEVKKPAKKAPAKKAAEGEAAAAKPKAPRAKKKPAGEGENLFSQQEPSPEA